MEVCCSSGVSEPDSICNCPLLLWCCKEAWKWFCGISDQVSYCGLVFKLIVFLCFLNIKICFERFVKGFAWLGCCLIGFPIVDECFEWVPVFEDEGGEIVDMVGSQTVGVDFSVPERILIEVLSFVSIFFVCLLLSQAGVQYSAVQ